MSFPLYERYKDSGVEWLGEVPEHWTVSRLGFESWVRARLGWRGLKAEEYVDDGYVFLSTPNLKLKQIDFDDVNYIEKERYEESPEIQLRAGDVLLAKDGSTLGTVNVVRYLPRPATVNSSVAVITPGKSLDGVYLYYLFQSDFMKHTIQRIKGGMGVPHLFQEDLNKFYVPLPEPSEQTRIASFLDAETAEIDALIEEQQRLIELLTEKRQAVISHAVTKGLNADAATKDSGLFWIGEVPVHWEIRELAELARSGTSVTYGIVQAGADIEGGIPYIRTSDMAGDELAESGYLRTSAEIDFSYRRSKVNVGDLVIAIRATVGKALSVPDFLNGANLTQGTAKFSPGSACDPDYVRYFLNTAAQPEFDLYAKGATFKEITLDKLRRIHVCRPPISEQPEIAKFVSGRLRGFNELIEKATLAVELLQERRSALISAAVTGKIDVRNYTPSEVAELEEAYEPA